MFPGVSQPAGTLHDTSKPWPEDTGLEKAEPHLRVRLQTCPQLLGTPNGRQPLWHQAFKGQREEPGLPGEAAEGDAEGRAEQHRRHGQAGAAGLVLPNCSPFPSRPHTAPQRPSPWLPPWQQRGAGHVTPRPAAISCQAQGHPSRAREAASAQWLPWPCSACMGSPHHVLQTPSVSVTSQPRQQALLGVQPASRAGGTWQPPWRTPCLAPPPPLPRGRAGDVTDKNAPRGCENK